jgi:hypothetical protein
MGSFLHITYLSRSFREEPRPWKKGREGEEGATQEAIISHERPEDEKREKQ